MQRRCWVTSRTQLSHLLLLSSSRNYPLLAVLGIRRIPVKKFWKFSPVYPCRHRFMSFENGRNLCNISGQIGCICMTVKTKHILAHLGWTPVAISHNFLCKYALWPLTYIPCFTQIHSGFQVLGVLTKTLPNLLTPPKMQHWLFKPIITRNPKVIWENVMLP